jgi:KaiC/GvpD/RAD55 family RecA-like ATPase
VVIKRVRETGYAPDWTEIVSDPIIGEDARRILKNYTEPGAGTREKVSSLLTTLDKYRKLRALVNMSQHVLDSIEDKAVDLDELIATTSDSLTQARARGGAQAHLHHFGKSNNTVALLKEMLYGKQKPSVPTGFAAFDDINGGILLGSLLVIGASTGGGKTALGINLLRNMTEFGAEDVVLISLEMSAVQCTDRLMGILTGLDVNKISQKRLSRDEKVLVKSAYRKYVKTLKENNTRYSIYEPEEDLTIEEILLTLKPMGYRVILIDYISLLKGADGDDQWRQLGNIARFAKVFAKNNNVIVALLCQVSEEGRIRYAQAIAEHANNAFIWTMPGEESETSILDINQIKARNQKRFRFQLLSNNSSMHITDIDRVEESNYDQETNKANASTGVKKIKRYVTDINEDDET